MMVVAGDHPALNSAAVWLRGHLEIPISQTIFDEFEQYFNCKLSVADREDSWYYPEHAVFECEKDYLLFMLRWS